MRCPNCNQPVEEGEKFCVYCGADLRGAENDIAPGQESGESLYDGPDDEPAPMRKDSPKKKKKKSSLFTVTVSICSVCLTIILICGGLLLYQNTDAYKAKKQLELGNRYLEEQNYEEAELHFNKALEYDDSSTDAELGLAEVYTQSNRPEQAGEIVDQISGHNQTLTDEQLARLNDYRRHQHKPELTPAPPQTTTAVAHVNTPSPTPRPTPTNVPVPQVSEIPVSAAPGSWDDPVEDEDPDLIGDADPVIEPDDEPGPEPVPDDGSDTEPEPDDDSDTDPVPVYVPNVDRVAILQEYADQHPDGSIDIKISDGNLSPASAEYVGKAVCFADTGTEGSEDQEKAAGTPVLIGAAVSQGVMGFTVDEVEIDPTGNQDPMVVRSLEKDLDNGESDRAVQMYYYSTQSCFLTQDKVGMLRLSIGADDGNGGQCGQIYMEIYDLASLSIHEEELKQESQVGPVETITAKSADDAAGFVEAMQKYGLEDEGGWVEEFLNSCGEAAQEQKEWKEVTDPLQTGLETKEDIRELAYVNMVQLRSGDIAVTTNDTEYEVEQLLQVADTENIMNETEEPDPDEVPVEEPTEEPVDEPVEEPVEEPIEEPVVEEPTEEPEEAGEPEENPEEGSEEGTEDGEEPEEVGEPEENPEEGSEEGSEDGEEPEEAGEPEENPEEGTEEGAEDGEEPEEVGEPEENPEEGTEDGSEDGEEPEETGEPEENPEEGSEDGEEPEEAGETQEDPEGEPEESEDEEAVEEEPGDQVPDIIPLEENTDTPETPEENEGGEREESVDSEDEWPEDNEWEDGEWEIIDWVDPDEETEGETAPEDERNDEDQTGEESSDEGTSDENDPWPEDGSEEDLWGDDFWGEDDEEPSTGTDENEEHEESGESDPFVDEWEDEFGWDENVEVFPVDGDPEPPQDSSSVEPWQDQEQEPDPWQDQQNEEPDPWQDQQSEEPDPWQEQDTEQDPYAEPEDPYTEEPSDQGTEEIPAEEPPVLSAAEILFGYAANLPTTSDFPAGDAESMNGTLYVSVEDVDYDGQEELVEACIRYGSLGFTIYESDGTTAYAAGSDTSSYGFGNGSTDAYRATQVLFRKGNQIGIASYQIGREMNGAYGIFASVEMWNIDSAGYASKVLDQYWASGSDASEFMNQLAGQGLSGSWILSGAELDVYNQPDLLYSAENPLESGISDSESVDIEYAVVNAYGSTDYTSLSVR